MSKKVSATVQYLGVPTGDTRTKSFQALFMPAPARAPVTPFIPPRKMPTPRPSPAATPTMPNEKPDITKSPVSFLQSGWAAASQFVQKECTQLNSNPSTTGKIALGVGLAVVALALGALTLKGFKVAKLGKNLFSHEAGAFTVSDAEQFEKAILTTENSSKWDITAKFRNLKNNYTEAKLRYRELLNETFNKRGGPGGLSFQSAYQNNVNNQFFQKPLLTDNILFISSSEKAHVIYSNIGGKSALIKATQNLKKTSLPKLSKIFSAEIKNLEEIENNIAVNTEVKPYFDKIKKNLETLTHLVDLEHQKQALLWMRSHNELRQANIFGYAKLLNQVEFFIRGNSPKTTQMRDLIASVKKDYKSIERIRFGTKTTVKDAVNDLRADITDFKSSFSQPQFSSQIIEFLNDVDASAWQKLRKIKDQEIYFQNDHYLKRSRENSNETIKILWNDTRLELLHTLNGDQKLDRQKLENIKKEIIEHIEQTNSIDFLNHFTGLKYLFKKFGALKRSVVD